MSKIVVFDTETTCSNGERLVSISCITFINGVKTAELNEYAIPDNWTITDISTKIHGITNKFAILNGIPISRIVDMVYNTIRGANLLVSHNIEYDCRILRKEFERVQNTSALSILTSISKYCTMINGRSICNILTKNGKQKNPKLDELHMHIFGEYFNGAHNATSDTYACARCYFRMNNIEHIGDIEYKVQMVHVSPCQKNIIDIFETNNVMVDAVAGSGKTTTCLFAAQQYPDDQFLVLTYNKKLKDETYTRMQNLRIHNMRVYTMHGYCSSLYRRLVNKDAGMLDCLNDSEVETRPVSYKRIIIDEAQDIRPLFFRFVRKVISLNTHPNPLICVMGDEYQCIYDYMGADVRYLTLADKIYNPENTIWSKQQLDESFRVTNEIAGFVNNCMLGFNRIKATRESGIKPMYIIDDMWASGARYVYDKIHQFISSGYKPDDIFVLGRSVQINKGGREKPITMLSNLISLSKYPQHVQADDRDVNERDIVNKIVFSSFHSAKGCERKIVILYDFDSYYYLPGDKSNKKQCPNVLYVAATRAREHLIIVHNYKNNYLPFLNVDRINEFANVVRRREIDYKINPSRLTGKSVTQLLKHIQDKTVLSCMSYLRTTHIRQPSDKINVQTTVPQKYENNTTGFEPVSDITGNAIIMHYQIKMQNKSDALRLVHQCISMLKNGIMTDIQYEYIRGLHAHDLIKNSEDLLRIATIWQCMQNMYLYRIKQISVYKWLTPSIIDTCMERIESLKLSQTTQYEAECVSHDKNKEKKNADTRVELLNYSLSGFTDAIDDDTNTVYEFKCTSSLEYVHIIQLACYMYLREIHKPPDSTMSKYILYNVLTDEMIQVESTRDELKMMMTCLISANNEKHDCEDNEKFIKNCIADSTSAIDHYDDDDDPDAEFVSTLAPINMARMPF